MNLNEISTEEFVREFISYNVYHGNNGEKNKDIRCDDIKKELLMRLRRGEKAIVAMEGVFKILCMKEFADTWTEERALKLKRLSELWNKYKDNIKE
jgi:hypothetical protein